MLNKLTSATLVTALFIGLGGTSAFAGTSSMSRANLDGANATSDVPEKKEAQSHPQLKIKMQKLVADAREGKIAPTAKSDIQPARSSNWSTGTKVAVGVGIAAAVVAIVVIVHAKKSQNDFIKIF